jgi:Domain of unknown function (DUF1996)
MDVTRAQRLSRSRRKWRLARLTVAPLFLMTVALSGLVGSAGASPGGGIFHTVCGYQHSLPDDPIVYPGVRGASHMHDFGGNAASNAFSTLASLQAGTTDCTVHAPDKSADRSGYWVPQLIFNGTPVSFSEQQAYYQSGGPKYVYTPPTGFEVVAGNAHATGPQSTSIVKFTCSGGAAGATNYPPVCPSGSLLKIVVFTPNCIAHALLTTAHGKNDTSQTTYATNGVCPSGFDPIAQVRIEVKYPAGVDGRGTVAFASGPYYTMHADWFNAWDHTTLDAFVQGCIDTGIDCGNTMPTGVNTSSTSSTSSSTSSTSSTTSSTSTSSTSSTSSTTTPTTLSLNHTPCTVLQTQSGFCTGTFSST